MFHGTSMVANHRPPISSLASADLASAPHPRLDSRGPPSQGRSWAARPSPRIDRAGPSTSCAASYRYLSPLLMEREESRAPLGSSLVAALRLPTTTA